LTPYCDAFRERHDSEPHAGKLASALDKLHKKVGVETLLPHWRVYLKATPPAYYSPVKFAETWRSWKPDPQMDPRMSRPRDLSRMRVERLT
jgi:hypothetical protein